MPNINQFFRHGFICDVCGVFYPEGERTDFIGRIDEGKIIGWTAEPDRTICIFCEE